jgi:hypothetical protein
MTTPRLSDPPRDVPPGVVFEVLARRDEFADSLWQFIPAAAAVAGAVFVSLPGLKAALLLLALLFFVRGLMKAYRALARSVPMLWSMRYGFLIPGRIVACRFAWERRRSEKPYGPFLSNWSKNLTESRVNSSVGCLFKAMALFLAAPLVLGIVAFAAGSLLITIAGPSGKATDHLGNFTFSLVATVVGFVAVSAFGFFVLRRGQAASEAEKYKEWRRMAQGAGHDPDSSELVDTLGRSSEAIKPDPPLPAKDGGVELICRLDYMVRGESVTGEGRVRLCDRLDLSGVEPLLFLPTNPGKVLFLAGLPAPVRIVRGEWEDLPTGRSSIQLLLPLLVAGATLYGFVEYLPVVVTLLR